jgi:hypothetical protein
VSTIPEDELAQVRARRAELKAEAEAVATLTPAEELERERRALAAEEVLLAAQRQHGAKRVALVETDEGPIVLRSPHVAAYRKFQDSDTIDTDKTLELVRGCVLHPSKAEVGRMLEVQPGALTLVANKVVELAGHRKADLKGK